MGLLDQMLVQGDDSLLRQELVKNRAFTDSVSGGINDGLGNMYNYYGPMLWTTSLYHDTNVTSEQIMAAVDKVVEGVRTKPVEQKSIDRALVKLRSDLYDNIGGFFGVGRADLLANFALFDDNPARINSLEAEFRKVTPEIIQRTAREYLRPTNRTVLVVEPGAVQPGAGR